MTKYIPAIVTTPLLIEAGEVQIDAMGWYGVESGCLESVTINKRDLTVAQVNAALFILCPGDTGAWSDDLDGNTLDLLLNEAAHDAACDHADHQREIMWEDAQ